MPFRPQINDTLLIDGAEYRFTPHPVARDMPYGQAGRRATVYQVEVNGSALLALKVFTKSFRSPLIAESASRIRPYAGVPGLQVCARLVLTPERHGSMLEKHPDLKYACLMPWVSGKTWQEVMIENHPLTQAQSLELGFALVRILATMEQKGLAHCDLSGPNIILPGLDDPTLKSPVALVDVEEMYATNLPRPEKLSAGSPGYAHKSTSRGMWNIQADRFAGAIILAELLSWCDAGIRSRGYGEQYFDPAEIHQDTERYQLMGGILERQWGESLSRLFVQTWHSKTLEECPCFMEWGNAIFAEQKKMHPEALISRATFNEEINPPLDGYKRIKIDSEETFTNSPNAVEVLLAQAVVLERQGLLPNALSLYEEAVALAKNEDARNEIEIIISDLKQKIIVSKQDDLATELPKLSDAISKPGRSNYKWVTYLSFPILVFAIILLINLLNSEHINSVENPIPNEKIINTLQTNTLSALYTQTTQPVISSTQTLFINTPVTALSASPTDQPNDSPRLIYVGGTKGKQDLFSVELDSLTIENLSQSPGFLLYSGTNLDVDLDSFVLQGAGNNSMAYIYGTDGDQAVYIVGLGNGVKKKLEIKDTIFHGLSYSSSSAYLAIWGKYLQIVDSMGDMVSVNSLQKLKNGIYYYPTTRINAAYNTLSWSPGEEKVAFWYYPIEGTTAGAQLCILDVEQDSYTLIEFPANVARGGSVFWITADQIMAIPNQNYKDIYLINLINNKYELSKHDIAVTEQLSDAVCSNYHFDLSMSEMALAVYDECWNGINIFDVTGNLLVDIKNERWSSWSPTGNYFATYSEKARGTAEKLFVRSINDSPSVEISPKESSSHWVYLNSIQWSPDGNRLSFLDCKEPRYGDSYYKTKNAGLCDLYVSTKEGQLTKITDQPEYFSTIFAPTWSPDGKMIAYTTGEETGNLFTVNYDGSNKKAIDKNANHDTVIYWSTNLPMQENIELTATVTPTATQPATSIPLTPASDVIKDESGALMSYIPAGEFTMGSDDGESDEGPAHQVDLDGYYIDQYEVTIAQYKICVEEGICQPPDSNASFKRSSYYNNSTYENYPVINVNWDMARNFCEWRDARLPTEAEWEKAARGTDSRLFPWGNELDSTYANYGKYVNDTTSVGKYEAGKSPYGVYDMAGNVWEWVSDWHNVYPGGDPNAVLGFGETFGEVRKVLRGGDFANDKKDILTYTRSANLPDRTSDIIGFRCAKDIH